MPINTEPVCNGSQEQLTDNRATVRDERVFPGRRNPKWAHLDVVRSHVEGHFAALLRLEDGPREITLVVSREPCSEPESLQGCEELLRDIIPVGKAIHVFVGGVDENGRSLELRYFRSYWGTGKGVK
ncbi:hypothetical protein Afil01_30010 [Actinorhabdospora filicis]|uniref:Uncharacterized protein n=1 Tax=Actinorhabdospora filicis TaxID=1785913 RepID=A0A9W6SJH6_9ACTN|nr:hypothetical protein Afil01_30010 [Actinorhabdospora filicis]